MSWGAAAGIAFEKIEENDQIAKNPDPAPKIAKLAKNLNMKESDIRASSLSEARLSEMFNKSAAAFRRGIYSLTAATIFMLPAFIGASNLLDLGHKASAGALFASEIFLAAGSSLYPDLVNRRIAGEIKNALNAGPAPN